MELANLAPPRAPSEFPRYHYHAQAPWALLGKQLTPTYFSVILIRQISELPYRTGYYIFTQSDVSSIAFSRDLCRILENPDLPFPDANQEPPAPKIQVVADNNAYSEVWPELEGISRAVQKRTELFRVIFPDTGDLIWALPLYVYTTRDFRDILASLPSMPLSKEENGTRDPPKLGPAYLYQRNLTDPNLPWYLPQFPIVFPAANLCFKEILRPSDLFSDVAGKTAYDYGEMVFQSWARSEWNSDLSKGVRDIRWHMSREPLPGRRLQVSKGFFTANAEAISPLPLINKYKEALYHDLPHYPDPDA